METWLPSSFSSFGGSLSWTSTGLGRANLGKHSMADKAFSGLFDLFGMPGNTAGRAALRSSAENFWEAQRVILANLEALNDAWFKRRREGTEAARAAACEMCDCGDAVAAIGAFQRGLAGSMGRITGDAVAAQAMLAKTAQAFLSAAQSAALSGIPLTEAVVSQTPSAAAPARKEAA